ncbi:hypothetical protein SDC9_179075 [bioreactor metagenome]|uniref:Uncharacterized protein n=1 Tax=bioreactor metagenome TaxID=1076179 RepID=A0A645GXJ9_9ZZZZ
MVAQAARAARMAQFFQHALGRQGGQQVELEGGAALGFDLVAQQGADGVDQAAFHTGGRGHKFATALEMTALAVGK